MVWSWRGSHARRLEARHRWNDLLAPATDAAEGLLQLGPSTEQPHGQDAPPDADDEAAQASGADEPDPARSRHQRARLSLTVRLAAVVGIVLAAVCGAWWWTAASAQPQIRPVASGEDASPAGLPADGRARASSPSAAGTAGAVASAAPAAGLTVHVVGAVVVPGVYRLAPGSRVHEAVAAAGGARPDAATERLNLAAPVEDGTRIVVPSTADPPGAGGDAAAALGPASAGPGTGGPGSAGPGRRTNINTATAEELAALPRVGPVLAQRIVDFRAAHGRFTEAEGLDAVSGVGPKLLEALLPLVTVQ